MNWDGRWYNKRLNNRTTNGWDLCTKRWHGNPRSTWLQEIEQNLKRFRIDNYRERTNNKKLWRDMQWPRKNLKVKKTILSLIVFNIFVSASTAKTTMLFIIFSCFWFTFISQVLNFRKLIKTKYISSSSSFRLYSSNVFSFFISLFTTSC